MASCLLAALWCVTVDVDPKMLIYGSRGWVRFPAYLDRRLAIPMGSQILGQLLQ